MSESDEWRATLVADATRRGIANPGAWADEQLAHDARLSPSGPRAAPQAPTAICPHCGAAIEVLHRVLAAHVTTLGPCPGSFAPVGK